MSKQSLQTHKGHLRKLIKDERLLANRRLLAEMLLLAIEGYIPLSLVESAYGSPSKVQWSDPNDNVQYSADKVDAEAKAVLKDTLASMLGEEHANSNSAGH